MANYNSIHTGSAIDNVISNALLKSEAASIYLTKTDANTLYPLKNGTGATGTWGISISGNAATATQTKNSQSVYGALKFSVEGDANTYYPVLFNNYTGHFAWTLLNISRGYSERAPDTWNTNTHRGGLTLTILSNGDTAWGGNHHIGVAKLNCILDVDQNYCTMVGGIACSTNGLIVWLRGGGADYWVTSNNGQAVSASVKLTDYTSSNNTVYSPRTTPVTSEIDAYRWNNLWIVDKANKDGSGNTITSYYCTLSTNQTISGQKTFTGNLFANGYVGIKTTTPTYPLQVNGTAFINGPLLVGAADTMAQSGYATDNVGINNYIAFYGVYGDNPGSFNHAYIGERIYGAKGTVQEQSELLIFKGNDIGTANPGPDRIRLLASQVDITGYTTALSGSFQAVGEASVTQICCFRPDSIVISVPFTQRISIANATVSPGIYPGSANIELREATRGMTNITHNAENSPRLGFHWGNRYWGQLALFDSQFRFYDATLGGYMGVMASAHNTSSSRFIKENITDITNEEVELLNYVRPVKFDYIEEFGGQKNQYGMIAEELEEIIPSVVSEVSEDAIDSVKGIDYGKLVPFLIKGWQIQQEEINNLKEKIQILENK